jgi:hypothetical protein
MRLPLTFRLTGVMLLVLLVALLLNAVLSLFMFNRTYEELVSSRFMVKATDLKMNVESLLNLGLALPEMADVPGILWTVKQDDSDIIAIGIFDTRGISVFDTDPARVGKLVPEAWRKTERVEVHSDDEAFVLSLPLLNSFDQAVGVLSLRYARTAVLGASQRAYWVLGKAVLIAMAVSGLVASLGLHLLSRTLISRLDRMRKTLTVEDGRGTLILTSGGQDEMEGQFAAFRSRGLAILRHSGENNLPQDTRKDGP